MRLGVTRGWARGVSLLLLAPIVTCAREPEPICVREEVVDHVAGEVSRRAPYAVVLRSSIGEQPGGQSTTVVCTMVVEQRDFDFVKYRTQTWLEDQEYTVRWLDPGYEVTMRDPVRR